MSGKVLFQIIADDQISPVQISDNLNDNMTSYSYCV